MMSIQEEIRDWLNKFLTRQFISEPDMLPNDECLAEAEEILQYLDSKGVRVCKLPIVYGLVEHERLIEG